MNNDFIKYKKGQNYFEISGKPFLLFFALFLLTVAFMFVYFTEEAGNLGFGDGYVCAYEHYQSDVSTIDLDDYTASEYCEQFSKLFDHYAEDIALTVNGAGDPIADIIPERRRNEIKQVLGDDTNEQK